MTLASFFHRLIRDPSSDPQLTANEDKIARQKATIRQNNQVLQSGARLVQNMSGAMRMISESERAKNSR